MNAVDSPPNAERRAPLTPPPPMSAETATRGRPAGLSRASGWSTLLWPPLVIATLLLVVPQAFYVWLSFHRDLGMGQTGTAFTFGNYARVLTDVFYLKTIWVTFYLSVMGTVVGLLLALPCAYLLARMKARWASHLLALLLMASFITLVVKVLGLSLLINREGLINAALRGIGLIDEPLQLTSNGVGVVIGLVQYTLPLLVMILLSVIQTIPESLEEAAEIHGASWLGTLRRVVLPIAAPGIINGALITFNMNMGAFTSAVLLGGGKVLTLPLLIQQKIVQDVSYGTGATLSTILLVFVLALNAAFAFFFRARRREPR
ncbi:MULTISPECIES: ABC transporter permease [unclassified Caballeronia]|uniref:ABC transporter permease n=1 Tax=unclassified Caballeronia TaxID=2646786 RepID=UPI002856B1F2|nr:MULTISPECIES: ABC transporter permease [unclassified Caballeronia]MDR5815093.1 ABC transporter permease [Caballeronia sp. LZ033]MDR5821562.1 ABC transporter permease [Caballeronia sp. LZ043]MDR5879785.1 ABC transporter permease [Caballeronia sp. LZ032]